MALKFEDPSRTIHRLIPYTHSETHIYSFSQGIFVIVISVYTEKNFGENLANGQN